MDIDHFKEVVKERKAIRREVFTKLRKLPQEVLLEIQNKIGWTKRRTLGGKLYWSSEIGDEWVVKIMEAMEGVEADHRGGLRERVKVLGWSNLQPNFPFSTNQTDRRCRNKSKSGGGIISFHRSPRLAQQDNGHTSNFFPLRPCLPPELLYNSFIYNIPNTLSLSHATHYRRQG